LNHVDDDRGEGTAMFATATRGIEGRLNIEPHGEALIGASPAFKEVQRQVEVVAPTAAPTKWNVPVISSTRWSGGDGYGAGDQPLDRRSAWWKAMGYSEPAKRHGFSIHSAC
jgi:hypothetical protein